nr:site-specific integrase [uncultured Clostridium sp.]
MRKTENLFPKLLGDFLSIYLPSHRNYSKNTISSYCNSFKLLLKYLKDEKNLNPDQITFKVINADCILDFLSWLEKSRNCSKSTVNQRLAAIHSFFKYVQASRPELISQSHSILEIPLRKTPSPMIAYLTQEDLQLILSQPNAAKKSERRDLVLLCLLYDTGCRVQELADLTVSSIRLEPPAQIKLHGKGDKTRIVPLMSNTAKLLRDYMAEYKLGESHTLQYPLFCNQRKEPLTRAGVTYILKKYADMARTKSSSIPPNVTPHVMRHSKAMHMLEAGINIVYIRDILGHVNISTTEVYARANLEMKRKALEKVSLIPEHNASPSWTGDSNLLNWLEDFGKSLS